MILRGSLALNHDAFVAEAMVSPPLPHTAFRSSNQACVFNLLNHGCTEIFSSASGVGRVAMLAPSHMLLHNSILNMY